MSNKKNLSFAKLFNLSFGFFGVQIAYALQSANISRIFATLGADPHQLAFFWILPPLMGMIVQPIVGMLSDRTWMGNFFGRRKFYLLIGAIIAVAVMILLPNAGDFSFDQRLFLGLNSAMWFGLFSLMFLDTSINIAMQPFKMMVGDIVNEEQKGLAYSIQSFLCNAGSLAGYIFPILFTWWGIANTAPEGSIPDSVKWSFYVGAAILILCVLYTFLSVKEMNPQEYAEYHGLNNKKEEQNNASSGRQILLSFLTVGLVQFFCWAAFLFMWTYSNGAIATQCFGWDGINAAASEFQDAGNWVGVCFAIQAVGSMIWATLIPVLEKRFTMKGAYAISLIVGAIGFISIYFVKDITGTYDATIITDAQTSNAVINLVLINSKYVILLSYLLIGAAWAAMLAIPFTIITNVISGSKNMGTLLGLFNCTICLPQIIAGAFGGSLLNYIGGSQSGMMVVAGVLLILGAASVFLIKSHNMKKKNLLLSFAIIIALALALIIFVPFGSKSLNYPTKSQYNYGLNSTITLNPGYNEFNTLDYITDVAKVDSVTSDFSGVKVKLSEDKSKVTLDVMKMPNIVNVALWVEGVPYSIICKRTDKIDYTFRYNPNGKTFNRVQLAGQMNDWVPSFHPDLTLNSDSIYEVTINVSPGTYMYQLVRDGDWNHDETNPEKVDNNSGKFNSILHIPSSQHLAPVLLTESYDDNKITLGVCNKLSRIYVYWENYLLPAKFMYISEDQVGIQIPSEAKDVKRSYIRAIAYNDYGISNDILVPLENGKVLNDVKQITRFDKHADVLYSLMVDRFKDGNKENNKPMNRPDVDPRADYQGGDLAGITEVIKSGYFEKMGFTTIWMTPLNQNPLEPYGEQQTPVKTKFSGYHGYWPISSTKVDFRIGTEAELKELTKTAHEHGLNVILDYVANHVHQEHPMFKQDPTICTPLILPDGSRNIAQWNEHRLTTWFDDFLPTLNYDRKEIVETMTDSALYWIKNYDLDGFRHDACKHVQESFWRTLTYKIKTQVEIPEDKPFYQVGESYGSPQLISSYVNSGMLNGQFDFNTSDDASAVFALNSEDFHRVSNTLNTSLRVYGSHNLMGYISGNHDRGRFISYASGSLKYGEDAKAVGWQREVGVGDPAGYDKIVQLNAFNLTIPGVPVIYYGDEFGMPGANDPDCRRMMRFDDELNEKEQTTLESVAKLGQLRKNNLPLIYGDFIELYLTNTEWVYARNYFGEIVITVFNRNLEEKEIKVLLPKIMQNKTYETTFGSNFSIEDGILTIKVKGNGVDVLTEK